MVKLLIATVLTLSTNIALAEIFKTTMDVACAQTEYIIKGLEEKYNEQIRFIGSRDASDEVFTTLWTNPGLGTWTVVTTSRIENVSCILQTGEAGYQLFKDDVVM